MYDIVLHNKNFPLRADKFLSFSLHARELMARSNAKPVAGKPFFLCATYLQCLKSRVLVVVIDFFGLTSL